MTAFVPDRDPGAMFATNAPGARPADAGIHDRQERVGRPGVAGLGPGRDWRFWALLALFALVTGLHLATPGLDSDQAVTGLMGMHILRGEFPIFFWRQDHAGVPESYGAAVSFFLFGISRLTLDLVPAVAALGLVLVLYRTGSLVFGHGAGLLAMLFATIVSPYVASHYVLARAYYIEQILLGHVVLLGAVLWLARPLDEPARARALIAMGLAGGVGLYCGFQIADALVPAALAVLLVDPRVLRRRGFWLALGAFLLGSAPFWIYNLTYDWATFSTGVRFQSAQSRSEAAWVLFVERLPVVLGVKEQARAAPYLPWPLSLVAPAIVATALGLLALRVGRGVRRLRQDPALAGEALLLTAVAVTIGVVWYGRYVRTSRYLVPLAPLLALILARACQLTWRRSRFTAVLVTSAYLALVGAGLVRELTVLWPASRAAYWAERARDQALFGFLRGRELRLAYGYEYWLAPRLTFDAREQIIVADPFRDRQPAYTQAVDASPRPAYIVHSEVDVFEHWMRATQGGAERTPVGPYTVFWGFTPPPPGVPLPRAHWAVQTSPGIGEPESLTDARLDSGWVSAPGPPGTAWIQVDLRQRQSISGVVLLTDHPKHVPHVLDVTLEDEGKAARSIARLETQGFTIAWRNGAPRTVPSHTLTVRFAPLEARRLRLVELGPPGTWVATELFFLGPAGEPSPIPLALGEGRRFEAAGAVRPALGRYGAAMRTAPDDPEGYAAFTRLAAETGLLWGSLADQRAVGPGVTHAELTRRRARLAAAAGEASEAARLAAAADAVLAAPHPAGSVFGRLVELTGYDIGPRRLRRGETLDLALYWRLLERPPAPLTAYVHFRSERFRFGDDHYLPSPIPGFPKGPQHVREARRVVIPGDAQPGRYRITVGVWQAESGRHFTRWWHGLLPTARRTVELGVLEVLPGSGPIPGPSAALLVLS